MGFPNWSLQLPGRAYQGSDPDGYASKDEFIRFLEDYASIIRAPVRRDTEVVALREAESRRSMILETLSGLIEAKNVVVATGPFQAPKIPALSCDPFVAERLAAEFVREAGQRREAQ